MHLWTLLTFSGCTWMIVYAHGGNSKVGNQPPNHGTPKTAPLSHNRYEMTPFLDISRGATKALLDELKDIKKLAAEEITSDPYVTLERRNKDTIKTILSLEAKLLKAQRRNARYESQTKATHQAYTTHNNLRRARQPTAHGLKMPGRKRYTQGRDNDTLPDVPPKPTESFLDELKDIKELADELITSYPAATLKGLDQDTKELAAKNNIIGPAVTLKGLDQDIKELAAKIKQLGPAATLEEKGQDIKEVAAKIKQISPAATLEENDQDSIKTVPLLEDLREVQLKAQPRDVLGLTQSDTDKSSDNEAYTQKPSGKKRKNSVLAQQESPVPNHTHKKFCYSERLNKVRNSKNLAARPRVALRF